MRIKTTTTKRKQMKDEELPHAITPKSLFYSVLGVLTLVAQNTLRRNAAG